MEQSFFGELKLAEFPAYQDNVLVGAQLSQDRTGEAGIVLPQSYVAWAGKNMFRDGRNIHINPKVVPGTPLHRDATRWCRQILNELGLKTYQLRPQVRECIAPGKEELRVSLYVRDMTSHRHQWSSVCVGWLCIYRRKDGVFETSSTLISRSDVPAEAIADAEDWMTKKEKAWLAFCEYKE